MKLHALLISCLLLVSCDNSSSAGTAATQTAAVAMEAPLLTPGTGTYDAPLKVVITCNVPSAQIRYTRDGTVPTSASMLYSDTLLIVTSGAIHAKAFYQGKESPLSIGAYGIRNP